MSFMKLLSYRYLSSVIMNKFSFTTLNASQYYQTFCCVVSMIIMWQGKSERSDWFFLGRDFTIRTVSTETAKTVYFFSFTKAGKFICSLNYFSKIQLVGQKNIETFRQLKLDFNSLYAGAFRYQWAMTNSLLVAQPIRTPH